MLRISARPLLVALLASLTGCNAAPVSTTDGGGPGDGSTAVCREHTECDDGVFCNGSERCEPDAAGADALGCIDGRSPCGAGLRCDEDDRACELCEVPDADGDGVPALGCGGNDCDDDDPERFPGRTEVCDAEGHDEDCDPSTVGGDDVDRDGEIDSACCNVVGTAATCGTDCNDTVAAISTRATESCNGLDDDCDGATDERVLVTLYEDADRDGFATTDEAAAPMLACSASEGWVLARGDCDDATPGVNPGVPEVCNAVDDDCDGLADDVTPGVVACTAGSSRPCVTGCGVPGTAACRADCLGLEACVGTEECNGCDDDADGRRDEDFECERGFPVGCTTACGTEGTRQCSSTCTLDACVAAEICNYCDDDGRNGFVDERTFAADSTTDVGLGYGGAAFGVAAENGVDISGGYEVYADILDGAAVEQAGAYWFDLDERIGWGPVRIATQVEVTNLDGGIPAGGWSIVIATSGTDGLGAPRDLGVPRTLGGVRYDWWWTSLETMGPGLITSDLVSYQRMIGGGLSPRGDFFFGRSDGRVSLPSTGQLHTGTTTVIQRMVIDYTPENPYTSAREEHATLTANGASRSWFPDGIRETRDPADDLPIGSRLRIGITAGNWAQTYTDTSFVTRTAQARVRVRLRLTVIRYPTSGDGEVTYTHNVTLSRALICPGT